MGISQQTRKAGEKEAVATPVPPTLRHEVTGGPRYIARLPCCARGVDKAVNPPPAAATARRSSRRLRRPPVPGEGHTTGRLYIWA